MASYGYFWGCYIQGRLPHLELSTRAVMARLGFQVRDLEGLSCCPEKGLIRVMSERGWLLAAARNLALAEQAGVDLVTPCTGCFGTLKGAARQLASSPELKAEVNRALGEVGRQLLGRQRVYHVVDLLYQELGPDGIGRQVVRPLAGMRVAVHYGCHLIRPSWDLALDDPFRPRKLDELVEALGAISITYETKLLCCGNLLLRAGDEAGSHALARQKLSEVSGQQADAIVVVCPSCTMQFDNLQFLLQRRGESFAVPVFYYTEMLGLALGMTPEELGLAHHRVDVGPFLEKWRGGLARVEKVQAHWDYRLLRRCAECGACAADCPVVRADPDWDPNALIRQLAEGELEAVLGSAEVWKCLDCYSCSELCFQRYSMQEIFRVAKHLAVEAGRVPAPVREGMQAFQQRGRLTESAAGQRRRLGLPELALGGGDELRRLLAEGGEDG